MTLSCDILADLVLVNGDFRTQDPLHPTARAVAIKGGRVLAVGGESDMRELAGPGAEVIDLEGRLGLPGFWDSHFHYYDWAVGRTQLELAEATSLADCMERLTEAARSKPPGQWILGQGWNEADWPEARLLTAADLDAAAPDHPVMLFRCDLHLATANSKALERAGVDDHTPNPPEGVIVRDESGRANGVLRELAPNLIKEVIPPPTADEAMAAMADGIPALHALGLTGIHDIRTPGGVEWVPAYTGWQRLRQEGQLDLRCWMSIPCELMDEAITLGMRSGFGDERLQIGHVKFFLDGGMGARTAWMHEPYLDTGDAGMVTYPVDELERAIHRADQAGLAVMIHAIGDRANHELISIFERVQRDRSPDTPPPALPHRIEHAQMVRGEDQTRMAKLGIAAAMQPHNLVLDINMVDRCVGELGRWTYSFRDLMDAGVPVIFSSDCPVCSPDPLVGIHAAVTRQRADGTPEGGWYPDQRVTVDEAVAAYTIGPARCYGMAEELGSITPGKRADIVVLDRNIYTIDAAEMVGAKVDMTVFDGRVVFRRRGI